MGFVICNIKSLTGFFYITRIPCVSFTLPIYFFGFKTETLSLFLTCDHSTITCVKHTSLSGAPDRFIISFIQVCAQDSAANFNLIKHMVISTPPLVPAITCVTFRFDRIKSNSLSVFPENFSKIGLTVTKKRNLAGGHFPGSVNNAIEDIQNYPLPQWSHLQTHETVQSCVSTRDLQGSLPSLKTITIFTGHERDWYLFLYIWSFLYFMFCLRHRSCS